MNMKSRWLKVAAGVLALALIGLLVYNLLPSRRHYTAQLPDAAGLRSGDDVRIAGITVGKVTGLRAEGPVVTVDFDVDDSVRLTSDTRDQVKLGSLLGQRFLQLSLGKADTLHAGGTLPVGNAIGTYTLERFWLDNGAYVGKLDSQVISKAVSVLSTDLRPKPGTVRAALDGMASVTDMVNKRADQITALVNATRTITDQVASQRTTLMTLLDQSDQVFTMLGQRKAAIAQLLADTTTLMGQLTAMARRDLPLIHDAMPTMQKILATLREQRDSLARTLELADPAMRLYVNSAGDGPWLGVNAPGAVFPDSYWCLTRIAPC